MYHIDIDIAYICSRAYLFVDKRSRHAKNFGDSDLIEYRDRICLPITTQELKKHCTYTKMFVQLQCLAQQEKHCT